MKLIKRREQSRKWIVLEKKHKLQPNEFLHPSAARTPKHLLFRNNHFLCSSDSHNNFLTLNIINEDV